jgi:heme/copper-type cytochrome/quinol oxidase subunit 3
MARAENTRRVLDVAALPRTVFGNQGLIWWGTTGFMVIEGSMFVIAIVVYFYLRLQVRDWPPSLPNPGLFYGTANLLTSSSALLRPTSPRRRLRHSTSPASGCGWRFWCCSASRPWCFGSSSTSR